MADLADHGIGGGGPNERLEVAVVGGVVIEDGLAQMEPRAETAARMASFAILTYQRSTWLSNYPAPKVELLNSGRLD